MAKRVAKKGRPRMKFLVPSMGSMMSFCLGLPSVLPCSSPITVRFRFLSLMRFRMAVSISRSPWETGVILDLMSIWRSVAVKYFIAMGSARSAISLSSGSQLVIWVLYLIEVVLVNGVV